MMTMQIIDDLYTVVKAGSTLVRNIDPDGLISRARLVKIKHVLVKDKRTFMWKAYFGCPDDTILIVSGQHHQKLGMVISNLSVRKGESVAEVPISPSETLRKALSLPDGTFSCPGCLSALKGQESPFQDGIQRRYDPGVIQSVRNVLFTDMDAIDVPESVRDRFNEISLIFHADKTDVVGICKSRSGRIIAKTAAYQDGYGSKSVCLEKKINGRYEMTAYCFMEDFSGRKIPSLGMALRMDDLLSGTDFIQKKEANRLEVPRGKRSSNKN